MNDERDFNYLNKIKEKYPKYFVNQKVLELGSRNVNGTIKPVFSNCDWVGIDWVKGDDVDVVCRNHEYKGKENDFDVLISFSTFEHDPLWVESIEHNLPFLKQDGLIIFSWCGIGSSPHGLDYSSNQEKYKSMDYYSDEYQELLKNDTNYYPKSLKEMLDLLNKNNVKELEKLSILTPEIGLVHFVVAKKI